MSWKEPKLHKTLPLRWMHGWMDGWMMNGWMYGWMYGWMDGFLSYLNWVVNNFTIGIEFSFVPNCMRYISKET
jgi:hypothetical protein